MSYRFRFRELYLYTGGVFFMWIGVLDSSDLLRSYPIISLHRTNHQTDIYSLININIYKHIYALQGMSSSDAG